MGECHDERGRVFTKSDVFLPDPEKLRHIHSMSCEGGWNWLVDRGNENYPARADVARRVFRTGRLGVSAAAGAEMRLSDQSVVRGAGVR